MNRCNMAVLVAFLLACGPSGSADPGIASQRSDAFSSARRCAKFRMIDLDPGGAGSHAQAVNAAGQVVGFNQDGGFSWTKEGGMIKLGTCSPAALSERGQVVGSLDNFQPCSWTKEGGVVDLAPPGTGGYATAVNDRGQVVGFAVSASSHLGHAFLWTKRGGMVDLGTLNGIDGISSIAMAINERGQVVGYSSAGDVGTHAFSWTREEGMRDLGTLGGVNSFAVAVNAKGQVVGSSTLDGDVFTTTAHAFLWTKKGGMIDLGTLGGSWSFAAAVNERGQVVGSSAIAGDAAAHSFSWTKEGGMVDLGTLGGADSGASGLNDEGQVVGTSDVLDQGASASGVPIIPRHAFSWTEECGMTDLGTLGGTVSMAYGVNARGQVVGDSLTGAADNQIHATLWEPQHSVP